MVWKSFIAETYSGNDLHLHGNSKRDSCRHLLRYPTAVQVCLVIKKSPVGGGYYRKSSNTPDRSPARALPVHPHSRGEHFALIGAPSEASGSSPLAWGTRCGPAHPGCFRRFIPTRVGNTKPSQNCKGVESVHPHSRGEHFFVDEVLPGDTGSSPLA